MKVRRLLSGLILVAVWISHGETLCTIVQSQPAALETSALNQATQPLPTPYFSNVTDEVSLTGVSGFRVSIADVNGDDYPDLLLHQVPESVPSGCETCKDLVLYLNVKGDDPKNRLT